MKNKSSKKSKVKTIFKIIFNVLTYIFFTFCVFTLILSVSAKKDADGTISLFGRQARVIVSDSMAKCAETDVSGYKIKDIPIKSLVFIKLVPESEEQADEWYRNLKKGDVLTFRYVYVAQETITHRITNITEKPTGGYIIELSGDNKSSDSDTLTQTIDTSIENNPNYVIGKVTGQSHFLGLMITALKSPVGLICIVIVPCAIISILEIVRICSYFLDKRKEKEKEENKKRDQELEDMRRELERLKNQTQTNNETKENHVLLESQTNDKISEE